MPKGQVLIRWTPEEEKKLLLAILATNDIKVDYDAVAKCFSPDLPGLAISSHLRNMRKKATAIGLGSSTGQPAKPSTTAKAADRAPSTNKPKTQKRKAGVMIKKESSEEDDTTMPSDSSDAENESAPTKRPRTTAATPSRQTSIAGKIIKPRTSPRDLAKKDYKAIENPFAGEEAMDEDGNPLFEETGPEDEEDDSSDDFGKTVATAAVDDGGDVVVKAEPEEVAV